MTNSPMIDMTIRPLRDGEASTLSALFAPLLPWHTQGGLYQLMQYQRQFLVAVVDGQPVAIGGYGPSGYSRHAWALGPAATLPEYQGRGIGAALIRARFDAISEAMAVAGRSAALIHVSSKRPQSWERLGFQIIDQVDGSSLLCRRLAAVSSVSSAAGLDIAA